MARKNLCITTFVFGAAYQEYIPIFIYSILNAYNDVYPIIFCHERLTSSIRKQLNLLSPLGKFKIVEEYLAPIEMTRDRGAAARWILYDPEFEEYEAVYFGDVDIFIVRETPSLYEQHITHCDVIQLPYSNVLRASNQHAPRCLKRLIKRIIWLGLLPALKSFRSSTFVSKRLSGLHFVKTSEYFPKLTAIVPKYRQIILSHALRSSDYTRHHIDGFDNEALLYDMMDDAGMGIPAACQYGPYLLDYGNSRSIGFRPHHGIHLAIFREPQIGENNLQILQLPFYQTYIKQFFEITSDDSVFQGMRELFSDNMINLFKRMARFHESPTASRHA